VSVCSPSHARWMGVGFVVVRCVYTYMDVCMDLQMYVCMYIRMLVVLILPIRV
jgi:hypothetical protein